MPEVQFGPYSLIKRIAVGGMAEVYLARAREGANERQVVVKQILPQLAEEPELLQLFFDEARIASRVVHPGIVRVLDVGEHDGVHFLAMEFVDGLDLSQLIRIWRDMHPDRQFPIGVALRVAIDLAKALHHVHEAAEPDGTPLEIVHRDVSPQNVLISKRGDVKLGDFGIARARIRAKKTATGVLRGKIAYVSPEQYLGQRGDRRVDVYAIGVVLFELLAGRRPFFGDEAIMIREIMTQDAPSLAAIVPGIDVRVSSIVALALARRPEDRIPTSLALAEALEALHLARPQSAVAELVQLGLEFRERGRNLDANLPAAPRPTQTLAGPPEKKPQQHTETLPVVEDAQATKILPKSDPQQPLMLGDTAPMAAVREADADEPETIAAELPLASTPDRTIPATLSVAALPRRPLVPRIALAAAIALGVVAGVLMSAMEPKADPPPEVRLEAVVIPVPDPPEDLPREPEPVAEVEPVETELEAEPEPEEVESDPEPEPEAEPGAVKRPRKKPARPRRSRAPAQETASAPPAPEPPPRIEAFGELSLDSEPWSFVHIGKRDLGVTPLANVRLPAGRHRVYLENPQRKMSRAITLTIKPDEQLAVRVRLEDGRVQRR